MMAWWRPAQIAYMCVQSFPTGQASTTAASTTVNEQLGEHGTTTGANVPDKEALEYEKMTYSIYAHALAIFRYFIGYDLPQPEGATEWSLI